MKRKLAWGTAFAATLAVGAFLLTRPRFVLSNDTRPEDRSSRLTERLLEIEALKKDLEAVIGMNRLGLGAEHTEVLLDAARKAETLKRDFLAARSGDLEQAMDVMRELRSAINRGDPHEELQEEADLLKRRFERFQRRFDAEMDAIVDRVLEALKDVMSPQATGDLLQTVDAVTKVEQVLDEIRFMPEQEYLAKIDQGIERHLDKTGIHDEEERAMEHARLREIADKARSMENEEFESGVHDLAEEILMKGATGKRMTGARKDKGGDMRKNVKEFLLRDSTVEILEERLEALRAK